MDKDQMQLLDNLYALLIEFDRICRKYNITYFLHCGTLLGAVREKDFIPWDDDIDLIMPQTELERFNEVVSSELAAGYHWDYPEDKPSFLTFHASLQDAAHPRPVAPGEEFLFTVFPSLDIYSMDNTSNSWLLRQFHFIDSCICYGLGLAHRETRQFLYPNHYTFFQFIVAKALRFLGKFTSLQGVYKRWHRMSARYRDRKNCRYVIISSEVPTRYKESFFHSAIFASTVEMPIRDRMFPCAVGYDEQLTRLYGDYMTPPPENERINYHVPQAEAATAKMQK